MDPALEASEETLKAGHSVGLQKEKENRI